MFYQARARAQESMIDDKYWRYFGVQISQNLKMPKFFSQISVLERFAPFLTKAYCFAKSFSKSSRPFAVKFL